jgi:tetratricopeptide (TPR) repeat protein
MLKANTKNLISVLISLTAVILSGCSDPLQLRIESLNEVAQLRASGDHVTALAKLETLAQAHPNDPEILQAIGDIHATLGNTTEAAFYLSAAHALSPNDLELHYKAYLAQEAAHQSDAAYELLEALAKTEPDAITHSLWRRLGALRANAQQTQSALDAYLKGVDPENTPPDAETVVAIGTLFKQLDNLPQAERWLTIAAQSDDPNALPALFGLLDIHLRNKNWVEAEATIAQLDQQFPGAVDASEWASYRAELEGWRAAQTKLQADLARKLAAEEAAKKAAAEAEAAKAAAAVATVPSIEPTEINLTDTNRADSTEGSAGKAQILADLEHAEAMADTPAVDVSALPSDTKTPTVAYNPAIAIEPAEPALPGVRFDQQQQGASIDYSVGSSDLNDSIAPDVVIPTDTTTASASAISTLPPRSLEHLLADAESATFEHDYKDAIQLYWQALGRANNRADIWNLLSRAYRFDGQIKNAETTALEATRLAPAEIDYTLDYLRVIQRSKKPDDFLAELQTAYDRFPRSPEIALSLARAYERIDGNNSAARILYERFIELAPNHSLRPEADTALSRLR